MATATQDIEELQQEISVLTNDLQNVTNELTRNLIKSEIERKKKCIRVAIKQTYLYVDVLLQNGVKYDKCRLFVDDQTECITDGTEAKLILRDLATIYIQEETQAKKKRTNPFAGTIQTSDIKHYALYHGLA
ncbi:MAG: hypothetical protein ACI35R_10310 [Bacillus sp. (in: firmicutes)]